MKRKKILHLISGLEIGGTEMQLLRILPELQKYHENSVCCVRGRGPIGKQLEENGVSVHYLEFRSATDFAVIYRFYQVIREFQPDILVTYLIHADLYGRVLGRLFGIKKIVSSKRGLLLQWEWLSFFDRLTKHLVTHYLVQTEKAKKEWMKKLHLFDEKRFTIIPNGIDTDQFQIDIDNRGKKSSLGLSDSSFVITSIGRLRRKKGHEYLLRAFENIFDEEKNLILLLVGDGEREDALKKQVTNYKSKSAIKFLGNRTDIPEILAITDIFALPTEGEGMSNAIIEAMAAGVPIITTDIEENRELIKDGVTGILFQKNDVRALSEKLRSLQPDPETRHRIGARARKEAERVFDIRQIGLKFAQFFEDL